MSRQRSIIVPLFLLSLVSLSGCISNKTLASNAVSYNFAVEKAQNRMLLTNILRASDRSPMYLTDVSKVTGSIKSDVTAGASIALGAPENGSRLLTPSTTYSVNPTFDVNVLSTQEFMRGFLQPVQKPTLGYYLDQGWPPEFLFHMLVAQVRERTTVETQIVEGKKTRRRIRETLYNNYPNIEQPGTLCEVQQFSRWLVKELLGKDIQFTSVPVQVGKDLSATGDLESIVNALKEGLSVEGTGGNVYRIRKFKEDVRLIATAPEGRTPAEFPKDPQLPKNCLEPQVREFWEAEEGGKGIRALSLPEVDPSEEKLAQREAEPLTVEMRTSRGEAEDEVTKVTFTLRSPEGVLYYLGQLQRVALAGHVAMYCIQKKFQPIFLAQNDTTCAPDVEVGYGDETYVIARTKGDASVCESGLFKVIPRTADCMAGRSMQALSLVSQLIALHKSAKDLPTTDVVRVIGQ